MSKNICYIYDKDHPKYNPTAIYQKAKERWNRRREKSHAKIMASAQEAYAEAMENRSAAVAKITGRKRAKNIVVGKPAKRPKSVGKK